MEDKINLVRVLLSCRLRLVASFYDLDILPTSITPYKGGENNSEWQNLVTFECRGLEPTDFDPRVSGLNSVLELGEIVLSIVDWMES